MSATPENTTMLLRPHLFLRPFVPRRLLLRRLLLGGGIVAILAVGGSAIIREARGATPAPANSAVSAASDDVIDALADPGQAADAPGGRLGFRARLGRHVVHAVVTVERDGKLLTFQLDRGNIDSIGDEKLTISEVGGASVTVRTEAQTRVRRDGKRTDLTVLKTGDEVYVISRAPSGADQPVAVRILSPTKEAANS
jgi:hypothetical protein